MRMHESSSQSIQRKSNENMEVAAKDVFIWAVCESPQPWCWKLSPLHWLWIVLLAPWALDVLHTAVLESPNEDRTGTVGDMGRSKSAPGPPRRCPRCPWGCSSPWPRSPTSPPSNRWRCLWPCAGPGRRVWATRPHFRGVPAPAPGCASLRA